MRRTRKNKLKKRYKIQKGGFHTITEIKNAIYKISMNNLEPLEQYGSIEKWDISGIKSMVGLFANITFNEHLNGIVKWDVSHVTSMSYMFDKCKNFNLPIENWDVSSVKSMHSMFRGCENFNQPLNNWNVSNVRDMDSMFQNCYQLNQPLNNWNVSNAQNMAYMFSGCKSFNQPLNNWNISMVEEIQYIFDGCINLNQPLHDWDMWKLISSSNKEVFENMFMGTKMSPDKYPTAYLLYYLQQNVSKGYPKFSLTQSEPLLHSNIQINPNDLIYDLISGENIKINTVLMDTECKNVIFYYDNKPRCFICLETIQKELAHSIFFPCKKNDGTFGRNNVLTQTPLFHLNKIGCVNGYCPLNQIITIIKLGNSCCIEIQPMSKATSIASIHVISKGEPDLVGASHCNGAEDTINKLLIINTNNMTAGNITKRRTRKYRNNNRKNKKSKNTVKTKHCKLK